MPIPTPPCIVKSPVLQCHAIPELPQVSSALLVDLRCPGEFSALLQEPASAFRLWALGDARGLQYRFFHLLARRKNTKMPQRLANYCGNREQDQEQDPEVSNRIKLCSRGTWWYQCHAAGSPVPYLCPLTGFVPSEEFQESLLINLALKKPYISQSSSAGLPR